MANEEVLKIAADKVVRVMNIQRAMAGERFTFRNEKVVRAMLNKTLTNIHVIPRPP